jgi:hypothetical protein
MYCSSKTTHSIESDDDYSDWQNMVDDKDYRTVNVNLILRLM